MAFLWALIGEAGGSRGGDTPSTLNPPSIAEPASTVAGSTHDLTASFSLAALESAIAAGGTVVVPAGDLDIAGIAAPTPPAGGVRIVGQGKGVTRLVGGFSLTDYSDSGADVLLWFANRRIELVDLTVRKVRCGILGAGTGGSDALAGGNGPDADALNGYVGTRTLCGNNPTAGIFLKNVAFEECGRWLSIYNLDTFDDLYVTGCDFVDQWIGGQLRTEGSPNDGIFFYNTMWKDIVVPDSPPRADERGDWSFYHNIGFGSTSDINRSSTPHRNIRFEHCTWDGLTSLFDDTSYGNTIYANCVRFPVTGGEPDGCWARYCLVKNLGTDSTGGRPQHHNGGNPGLSSAVSYCKGGWLWDVCVFENIAWGNEALFNRKGGKVAGEWRHVNLRNCYIKGVYDNPAGTRSIIGPHPFYCSVDNVHIEDATLEEGIAPNGYGSAARGPISYTNITLKDISVTFNSDWGHLFHQGSSDSGDLPDITLENIKASGLSFAAADLRALLHVRDPTNSVRIRQCELDVAGSGATGFTLLEAADSIDTIDGTPEGAIVGVSPIYAQAGSAVSNASLGAYTGPTVTGADLSWMTEHVIGCISRPRDGDHRP